MAISTCADTATAKEIANALVGGRLAACVQMMPIESIYAWQGKVCDEGEIALLIKTKVGLFDKIVAAIKGIHPYEVPEIIQLPITGGSPEYLRWIDGCVEGNGKASERAKTG